MHALCPGALRDKRPKRRRPHQLSADAADVVVAAPHANEVVRANSVRARVAPQTADAAATPLPPSTTLPPPKQVRVPRGSGVGL